MVYLVMGLIMILTSVMQVQFPGSDLFAGAKVPFLMGVVLYYALSYETAVMLMAGLFAGLLQDALSEIPLGYSSLVFCAIGWIVSRFRKYVLAESFITPVFFGGTAGCLFAVAMYTWLANEGLVSYGAGRVFMRILGTSILGMICAPIVFLMVRSLDQLVGNIELKEEIDVFE